MYVLDSPPEQYKNIPAAGGEKALALGKLFYKLVPGAPFSPCTHNAWAKENEE
jgi:hypothetical protein